MNKQVKETVWSSYLSFHVIETVHKVLSGFQKKMELSLYNG